MTTSKIESLKQVAANAQSAYVVEQERLTALGLNSKARYPLLKALKAEADAKHEAYSRVAKTYIRNELDKIIESDRPAREAAARGRSPWKQAKFDAANKA